MGLEIVKVERPGAVGLHIPPDIGTQFESIWQAVKRRPAAALVAAPFVVGGAAATAAATTIAIAAIGVNELVVRANDRRYLDGRADKNVETLRLLSTTDLTDIRGKTLQSGASYIRHPVRTRREELINARSFHKVILEEQLAEIVEFIRSRLNATSIVISAVSEKTGAFVAGGSINSLSIGARLGLTNKQHYALKFDTRTPIRVVPRRSLVWINDFPVLQASLAEARDGRCIIEETADLEFDLNAEAAGSLGIDARWVSKFSLSIEVEFT